MKSLNLSQAFIMGYIMMALEMVGARSLSPYFGSGIHIWASVITCMLLSLAIGSIYGGRIADRYKSMEVFGLFNIVSSFYILLMSFIYDDIFELIQSQFQTTILGAIVAAFILIMLPIALLGMFSPFAIRCSLLDVSKSGNISGDIYGISTIGSVVGTLVTTFYFIPNLEIKVIFIMIFLMTFISGIIYLGLKIEKLKKSYLMLSGLILFLSMQAFIFYFNKQKELGEPLSVAELRKIKDGTIYKKDSGYNILKVKKIKHSIYLVHRTKGRDALQSKLNLKDPDTSFGYQELLKTLYAYVPNPKKILVLGSGGGDFTRFARRNFKKVETINVDIDPETIKIGQKYFGMENSEKHSLVSEDARIFLRRSNANFNIIVIDVFTSSTIPHHLVTKEFFELVHSKLSMNSCIAMNLHKKYKSYPSIIKTIGAVFKYIHIYSIDEKDKSTNAIAIACNRQELDELELNKNISLIQNQRLKKKLSENLTKRSSKASLSNALVLTDNYSPINFLNIIED